MASWWIQSARGDEQPENQLPKLSPVIRKPWLTVGSPRPARPRGGGRRLVHREVRIDELVHVSVRGVVVEVQGPLVDFGRTCERLRLPVIRAVRDLERDHSVEQWGDRALATGLEVAVVPVEVGVDVEEVPARRGAALPR